MNDPTDWSTPPDFGSFDVGDPELAKEIERRWNAYPRLINQRCHRCNRANDESCPWPDCPRGDSEAISLLRAWVAGCGDEHFSTKEECRELLERSSELLRNASHNWRVQK